MEGKNTKVKKFYAIPTEIRRFKFMGYASLTRVEDDDGLTGNRMTRDVEIPLAACPKCGSLVLYSQNSFKGHKSCCPGWVEEKLEVATDEEALEGAEQMVLPLEDGGEVGLPVGDGQRNERPWGARMGSGGGASSPQVAGEEVDSDEEEG